MYMEMNEQSSEWIYYPADLAACEVVFKEIREEFFHLTMGEKAIIAAVVLEFYRQGIRDPEELKRLALGSRGLNMKANRVDTH